MNWILDHFRNPCSGAHEPPVAGAKAVSASRRAGVELTGQVRGRDGRTPNIARMIFIFVSHASTRTNRLGRLAAVMMAIIPGCGGPWGNADEVAAVAMIQKLGGKVEFEGEKENRRVTKVDLHNTRVKDADLRMLSKLAKLRNLFLGKTQIDDAGLEHLQNSSELQTLSLNSTRVTDAGLESLTKLTKLKTLNVQETQVTATGAARLRKALPGATIAR